MATEYVVWVSEVLELINLQNAARYVEEGENVVLESEIGFLILSRRQDTIRIRPLFSSRSEFVYIQ